MGWQGLGCIRNFTAPRAGLGAQGHIPWEPWLACPPERSSAQLMATTGILMSFEHPLDVLDHRNHVLEGTAQSCTSSLCPCSLWGPSGSPKDCPHLRTMTLALSPRTRVLQWGKPVASARTRVQSSGEECSLYTRPLQDAEALSSLQRHVNKIMERTMQDG